MKGVGTGMETQSKTKNRGFASLDTTRQREIARKGGRGAQGRGKAHEFTPDEARAAGRKGGEKVSVNRRHMAEIGRRGGRSSAQRRRPGGNAAPDMHRVSGDGREGRNAQMQRGVGAAIGQSSQPQPAPSAEEFENETEG